MGKGMGTKHGMGIKSVGGGTNVLVSLVLTSDDLESLCLGPEIKEFKIIIKLVTARHGMTLRAVV